METQQERARRCGCGLRFSGLPPAVAFYFLIPFLLAASVTYGSRVSVSEDGARGSSDAVRHCSEVPQGSSYGRCGQTRATTSIGTGDEITTTSKGTGRENRGLLLAASRAQGKYGEERVSRTTRTVAKGSSEKGEGDGDHLSGELVPIASKRRLETRFRRRCKSTGSSASSSAALLEQVELEPETEIHDEQLRWAGPLIETSPIDVDCDSQSKELGAASRTTDDVSIISPNRSRSCSSDQTSSRDHAGAPRSSFISTLTYPVLREFKEVRLQVLDDSKQPACKVDKRTREEAPLVVRVDLVQTVEYPARSRTAHVDPAGAGSRTDSQTTPPDSGTPRIHELKEVKCSANFTRYGKSHIHDPEVQTLLTANQKEGYPLLERNGALILVPKNAPKSVEGKKSSQKLAECLQSIQVPPIKISVIKIPPPTWSRELYTAKMKTNQDDTPRGMEVRTDRIARTEGQGLLHQQSYDTDGDTTPGACSSQDVDHPEDFSLPSVFELDELEDWEVQHGDDFDCADDHLMTDEPAVAVSRQNPPKPARGEDHQGRREQLHASSLLTASGIKTRSASAPGTTGPALPKTRSVDAERKPKTGSRRGPQAVLSPRDPGLIAEEVERAAQDDDRAIENDLSLRLQQMRLSGGETDATKNLQAEARGRKGASTAASPNAVLLRGRAAAASQRTSAGSGGISPMNTAGPAWSTCILS
ncbi:unnamed protein product [Amoebophrya sp. A120]|nr:unnamed protein product [Amoebophrya sp. A120]|eukprot:GSA120T00020074001.1